MLKATFDNLIVRLIQEEKIGSIIISDNEKGAEAPFYGKVVSVGPLFPYPEIQVGSGVIFSRHEGIPIEKDGKKYLVLKKERIHGYV